HLEGDHRFKLLDQDVRDLVEVPEPIDLIFHLASPASPIHYERYPIETLLAGSEGTHRWLQVACEKQARFLLASTSEVYGDPDPQYHPQPERYNGNVNPVGPRSCYDEAKRFAEALTTAYHEKRRVQTRIIRIFNTYGPRMRSDDGRVIPMLLSQALDEVPLTIFGVGSQTRSFCYVDDLVAGIIAVMASDFPEPVNLGNPDEITVLDLAREILALTGSRSKIVNYPSKKDEPRQRRP